jgi:hypothetical protein
MQELLRMVQEGRLHEADEHQLETLKLTLELSNLLEQKQPKAVDVSAELIDAVKHAISEGLLQGDIRVGSGSDVGQDSARPEMRHVSLAELTQVDEDIDIAHKAAVSRTIEGKDSVDKLEKLRQLKKAR